jgi:hypothetical protein
MVPQMELVLESYKNDSNLICLFYPGKSKRPVRIDIFIEKNNIQKLISDIETVVNIFISRYQENKPKKIKKAKIKKPKKRS